MAFTREWLDGVRERLAAHYADARARGMGCEPGTGPNVTGAVVHTPPVETGLESVLYDGRDFYAWFLDGENRYVLLGD